MNFSAGAKVTNDAAVRPISEVLCYYPAKYFGYGLCNERKSSARPQLNSRALEAMTEAGIKPKNITVLLTTTGLSLMDGNDQTFAFVPLREIACFTRHKKNGKAKMFAALCTNTDKDHADKKFQVFMFSVTTSSQAEKFHDNMKKAINAFVERMQVKAPTLPSAPQSPFITRKDPSMPGNPTPTSPVLVRAAWD